MPLPNMVLEVRDNSGQITSTTKTDVNGDYALTKPAGQYYICPVPDRTEFASPNTKKIITGGAKADFKMGAVPATLKVLGTPSAFVAISTYAITAQRPPDMVAGGQTQIWSSVIEGNGFTLLKLPAISAYLTCWTLGSDLVMHKGTSISVNSGTPLVPQQAYQESCP